MSGRLCCYNQQQHSKLLAQFVLKVSAFRFNTRTKMHAQLPDCRINNALTQFVPSCQEKQTQFIDILDPPFSDTTCSITGISCLVVGIFMPRKQYSKKVLSVNARVSSNYASSCSYEVSDSVM